MRLRGLVKARGKLASDRVAQLSTAPRGRSLPCSTASPQAEPVRSGTTAVATVVLTINMPRRAVIHQRYTDGSAAVPQISTAGAAAGLCRPRCTRSPDTPNGRDENVSGYPRVIKRAANLDSSIPGF
jgi:hypothetical protein